MQVRSRVVASERRCIVVDRQCRESEGKAKIEGYMSVSDEGAHHWPQDASNCLSIWYSTHFHQLCRGWWALFIWKFCASDESTHQIPSNALLFLTFYHFPYTADPPTSAVPMWPSPTITRSPLTIPYTSSHHQPSTMSETSHMTYGPCCYIFPFLVSSPLSNVSFHGPTNHKSSHHTVGTLPYASPHMNLVLVLLIICI